MKHSKIRFYENRYKYLILSGLLIITGIVFNVLWGTKLDLQFTGGTLLKYSYTNDISETEIISIVKNTTGKDATIQLNTSFNDSSKKNLSITFPDTETVTVDHQQAINEAISAKYPDNSIELLESSSISPIMGQSFFLKCLCCIGISFLLLTIYIAFRFRKIGGLSAGIMAIVALLHDVIIVYFVFIVCRIPLNDNFIAVVLTILGYSLNDTIVVYDRIRENRKLTENKQPLEDIVNLSINQILSRSIYTSISTFIAIGIVYIVGMIYGLHSITTFALPMMVGILVGCYSSICIAGPLYAAWQNHKKKKVKR